MRLDTEWIRTKDSVSRFFNQRAGCLPMVLLAVVLMLCSCQTIKYVPVETVRTDTVYQAKVQHDSIHVRDSIRIHTKGDSVFVDRWHTKYIEKLKTDTVYRSRTEYVSEPYPVEKPLTRWQSFCIDYGKITLGATILLLVIVAVGVFRKVKGFKVI